MQFASSLLYGPVHTLDCQNLLSLQNRVCFERNILLRHKAAGIVCPMAAIVSNFPSFDWSLGAFQSCSLNLSKVYYISTFAGCALYLAIFALILAILFFLGIRHSTWGFLSGLLSGLLLELIGFICRVQLRYNKWLFNPFVT